MTDQEPTHVASRKLPYARVIVLLVVALVCFAAYEWNWILQRRHLVDREVIRIALINDQLTDMELYTEAPQSMPLSTRLLTLLGENPRQMVVLVLYDEDGSGKLTDQHRQELSWASSLFPESAVSWKLTQR